jgi:ADP-heptose:LPS heptosyltransferase
VATKPKLLVLELWGLGDLVIATPFLRAAAEQFAVTLVAKPFALELQPRLWPEVQVLPFVAPWTAFHGKYHFWHWPWREISHLRRQLLAEKFDCGISARWDPRDHLMLKLSGARERIGFPRLQSQRFLTQPQQQPNPLAHRSEFWRVGGQALGLSVPAREKIISPARTFSPVTLIHSGARLSARVWPLENFRHLAEKLRKKNIVVQIACDPDQLSWWKTQGENVSCPQNVTELFALIDRAGIFIGNCSGPGHLAAICGVPTFTVYGPSLHEWFVPMHPAAEVFEGRACPYKPCSDYCRYAKPFCLSDITADEVWPQVEKFAQKNLSAE